MMNRQGVDFIFWLLIVMCCIAVISMGITVSTSEDNQWTSIHDELPQSGEVVNICTKDQDIYMAMYQDGKWVEVDREYWELQDVTMWRYRQ